jgi:glycosyltransferase involved in cell wall biosynthesis
MVKMMGVNLFNRGKVRRCILRVDILVPNHAIWSSLLEYPADGVSYSQLTLMRSRFPSNHVTHFGNGLPYTLRRRAVVDFESVKAFYSKPPDMHAKRRLRTDFIYAALSNSAKLTFEANIANRCDVRIVRPGIRVLRRPRTNDGNFNIVLVGGSTSDGSFFGKGGLYLIDALNRLHDTRIKLHLISNIDTARSEPEGLEFLDSEGRSWTELYKEATASGWLKDHGRVPREKALDIMASSQLAAIPAFYDTVCYSLMEAAYLGTPLLTSDTLFMKEFYGDLAAIVPAPASIFLDNGAFNPRFGEQVRVVKGDLSSKWADIISATVDTLSNVSEFKTASERAMKEFDGSIDSRNHALRELYMEVDAR